MQIILFVLLVHVPLSFSACSPYWYEAQSKGWSYRNVSQFGGDPTGVLDSTAALQAAIDYQRGGDAGSGQDKGAATVYLPPGTYVISDTIVLWKWTKLQSNPNCPATLLVKAGTPAFSGAAGYRPVLVTADGNNLTTALHQWWLCSDGQDATNENFFTQLHYLKISIQPGNPGAVPITWNVAQQTSLRSVAIAAAPDTPIALDVGAGPEYEHWNAGVPYSLGGGGTVEDVSITGGQVGVRVGAAQFLLRNLQVSGVGATALEVAQLAWSVVFQNCTFSALGAGAGPPVALRGAPGDLPGAVTLLDSRLLSSGPTFVSTQGSSLVLQNVQATTTAAAAAAAAAPTQACFIVDATLPCPSGNGGTVGLWTQGGAAFSRGAPTGTAPPLPSLGNASAQGIPLACTGSSASGARGGSVRGGGRGAATSVAAAQRTPTRASPMCPAPAPSPAPGAPLAMPWMLGARATA
jgi:hypothetical protein